MEGEEVQARSDPGAGLGAGAREGDRDGGAANAAAARSTAKLDLVFVLDCTASMTSYIKSARDNIVKIVERIGEEVSREDDEENDDPEKENPNDEGRPAKPPKVDVRFALVAYRDHPPQDKSYITKVFKFTDSVRRMRANLAVLSAQGGGDGPEAVTTALRDARDLPYREGATKIVIVITDAPPHGLEPRGDGFPDGEPNGIDPIGVVRDMFEKDIIIYTVGCEPALGNYTFARDFYAGIAKLTEGQFLPLSCADLLNDVIIGGALEEMSLEQLRDDVDDEVEAMREAYPEEMENLTEEQLIERVLVAMQNRGVKTRKIKLDILYENFDQTNVDAICQAESLAAAKKLLDPTVNAKLRYSNRSKGRKGGRSGRRRSYSRSSYASYSEGSSDSDDDSVLSEDESSMRRASYCPLPDEFDSFSRTIRGIDADPYSERSRSRSRCSMKSEASDLSMLDLTYLEDRLPIEVLSVGNSFIRLKTKNPDREVLECSTDFAFEPCGDADEDAEKPWRLKVGEDARRLLAEGRPGSTNLNIWIPLLGHAGEGVAYAKQINPAAGDDAFVEVTAASDSGNELAFSFVHPRTGTPQVTPLSVIFAEIVKTLLSQDTREKKGKQYLVSLPGFLGRDIVEDIRRATIKRAMESLGLEVARIVLRYVCAERSLAFKTAAAMRSGECRFLHVHIGGKSTEVNLIDSDEEILDVLETDVDYTIGGHKIDAELERHFLASLKDDDASAKELRIKLEGNSKLAAQLRQSVVHAKESPLMNKRIEVNFDEETVAVDVSQAKFDHICNTAVTERLAKMLSTALSKRGDTKPELILLTGQSTRLPAVAKSVKDCVKGLLGNDIELAVCNEARQLVDGAGNLATLLSGSGSKSDDILLCDVTPLSVGLQCADGRFLKIVPRNTTIPTSRRVKVTTSADNQGDANLRFYEGEHDDCGRNSFIGEVVLADMPRHAKGTVHVDVTVSVDTDGVTSVSAELLAPYNKNESGADVKSVVATLGGKRLSAEEIERMVSEASPVTSTTKHSSAKSKIGAAWDRLVGKSSSPHRNLMMPSPRDVNAALTDGDKKKKKNKKKRKAIVPAEEKKEDADESAVVEEAGSGESRRAEKGKKKKKKKDDGPQAARVESSLVDKEQIRRLFARSKHNRKKVAA